MTNKVLSPEDQEGLRMEFMKVEENLGKDRRRQFERFAEELAQNLQSISEKNGRV
jgi:hypothetical protein